MLSNELRIQPGAGGGKAAVASPALAAQPDFVAARVGIAVARGGFTTGRILGKLGDGKSGGGGTVINNYFPNYVGDKADLMSAVRSELGKLQNRQGRSGLR